MEAAAAVVVVVVELSMRLGHEDVDGPPASYIAGLEATLSVAGVERRGETAVAATKGAMLFAGEKGFDSILRVELLAQAWGWYNLSCTDPCLLGQREEITRAREKSHLKHTCLYGALWAY